MDRNVQTGVYVVAVSGGLDSMVLLHMLLTMSQASRSSKEEMSLTDHAQKADGYRFVVAHFDHGIRVNSHLDRRFVQKVARQYGMEYVFEEGRLGPTANEATARAARYAFLHRVKHDIGARAIITAHHQDDVLETACINMIRGTQRRGITSLTSTDAILRPLLQLRKADLLTYAEHHKLSWREDATNMDQRYLRNYVRHALLAKCSEADRNRLTAIIEKQAQTNASLDMELATYLRAEKTTTKLSRKRFVCLPHVVAKEVMAAWLRANNIRSYDQRSLLRLVIAAKTWAPGRRINVGGVWWLKIGCTSLALESTDR